MQKTCPQFMGCHSRWLPICTSSYNILGCVTHRHTCISQRWYVHLGILGKLDPLSQHLTLLEKSCSSCVPHKERSAELHCPEERQGRLAMAVKAHTKKAHTGQQEEQVRKARDGPLFYGMSLLNYNYIKSDVQDWCFQARGVQSSVSQLEVGIIQ